MRPGLRPGRMVGLFLRSDEFGGAFRDVGEWNCAAGEGGVDLPGNWRGKLRFEKAEDRVDGQLRFVRGNARAIGDLFDQLVHVFSLRGRNHRASYRLVPTITAMAVNVAVISRL
jgi:hypothetical protein